MQKQHGMQVLIVGDHAEFVGPLRGAGHEVVAAPDGPSALDASARVVLDVVVLDLDLPDLDASALVGGIRGVSLWRKPMFIALGQRGGEEPYRRCLEAGIDLHLVKPVRADLLEGFLGRLQAVVEDIESFDPVI